MSGTSLKDFFRSLQSQTSTFTLTGRLEGQKRRRKDSAGLYEIKLSLLPRTNPSTCSQSPHSFSAFYNNNNIQLRSAPFLGRTTLKTRRVNIVWLSLFLFFIIRPRPRSFHFLSFMHSSTLLYAVYSLSDLHSCLPTWNSFWSFYTQCLVFILWALESMIN